VLVLPGTVMLVVLCDCGRDCGGGGDAWDGVEGEVGVGEEEACGGVVVDVGALLAGGELAVVVSVEVEETVVVCPDVTVEVVVVVLEGVVETVPGGVELEPILLHKLLKNACPLVISGGVQPVSMHDKKTLGKELEEQMHIGSTP